MSTLWPGNHPDDLLSALLDGELAPHEVVAVEAHVEGCEACRADLEAERSVRDLVRELAAVDAPFGFYERVLRQGPAPSRRRDRRLRWAGAGIGGAAAAWLAVLGLGSMAPAAAVASPAVAQMVEDHGRTASPLGAAPDAAAQRELGVPPTLAGTYRLVAIREGRRPQAVYSDGEHTVSVFVVPGRLDVDVKKGALATVAGDQPAWQVSTATVDVVLLQRDGVVVAVVGSEWPKDLVAQVALAEANAGDDSSFGKSFERACRELLSTFGLRG